MNALYIGILVAILGTFGIGFGDFFAGLSARKLDEKKTLLFIFSSQTVIAFLYWILLKHQTIFNPIAIVTILVAGVFQAIGLMLFYKAMSVEKISLISPIFATYAVLTILFGIFILKDSLGVLKILGIISIFIGAIFASSDFSTKKFTLSKGVFIALSGTIFFAIAFLLMTLVFKFGEFYFANFLYSFSTFLTAVVINRKTVKNLFKDVKYITLPLMVGFVYATSNLIWAFALTKIPSSIFGTIGGTFPAITAVAGFIFLKERLARIQLAGICFIIIGLILLGF